MMKDAFIEHWNVSTKKLEKTQRLRAKPYSAAVPKKEKKIARLKYNAVASTSIVKSNMFLIRLTLPFNEKKKEKEKQILQPQYRS